MADIHIKIDDSGVFLWRTTRALNGGRVRTKGVAVHLPGKEGITASLPIFNVKTMSLEELGEFNDNRTG